MDDSQRLRVAVAAMRDDVGAVLLSQRGVHKSYAGQWEFPGGKIEGNESVAEALARELDEELGIAVQATQPLISVRHDYPDLAVHLAVHEVVHWVHVPRGREGQALSWVAAADLPAWPLLAADAPIIHALQLPDHYAFTAPDMPAEMILAGAQRLPADALLRLRLPTMADADYELLARQLRGQRGAMRLAVDRAPELAVELGCWWHASGRALAAYAARQVALPPRTIVSVHDAEGLEQAWQLGAAAAVLGPVQATASHPEAAGLGWAHFGALVDAAQLPVYGIGGLAPGDAAHARQVGGRGVAGIRAYW